MSQVLSFILTAALCILCAMEKAGWEDMTCMYHISVLIINGKFRKTWVARLIPALMKELLLCTPMVSQPSSPARHLTREMIYLNSCFLKNFNQYLYKCFMRT